MEKIKKVKFRDDILHKENETKYIKKYVKPCKIKRHKYNQEKAHKYAVRLHNELLHEELYDIRNKKESYCIFLLQRHKLYYQILKVYRISNKSLDQLISRLSHKF
tara:strand:- start:460 stop:774 length:315 start_codon:yes stop_codon:yes gene_type:complete